jgi:hypothetical protein
MDRKSGGAVTSKRHSECLERKIDSAGSHKITIQRYKRFAPDPRKTMVATRKNFIEAEIDSKKENSIDRYLVRYIYIRIRIGNFYFLIRLAAI